MGNDGDLEITLPGGDDETSEDAETQEDETTEESSEETEEGDEETSEEDSDKDEESDEEKKDDEEKDDEKEDDKKKPDFKLKHTRPSYRDIKEKFPEFFKTFPDLRDAFFREREYSKIFPTVDDAKEALSYAQSFSEVSSTLMKGDPNLLLEQLNEANPQAFKTVAENFLPAIHKLDKETFFEITTPLIERFVQSMDVEGQKTGDANLRKAALVVGKFLTGEFKIPNSRSERREDPERGKLAEEKTKFYQERFNTAQQDVFNTAGENLNSEIEKSLADEELTDFMRQKLGEEILKNVNRILQQDEGHMALMNSLWRKWEKSGFSAEAKKALVNTYLSRAKRIVTPVRDRVLKDAMKRKPIKKINKQRESDSDNEGESNRSGGVTSARQVDWKKTSELDFLNDKVTPRK